MANVNEDYYEVFPDQPPKQIDLEILKNDMSKFTNGFFTNESTNRPLALLDKYKKLPMDPLTFPPKTPNSLATDSSILQNILPTYDQTQGRGSNIPDAIGQNILDIIPMQDMIARLVQFLSNNKNKQVRQDSARQQTNMLVPGTR